MSGVTAGVEVSSASSACDDGRASSVLVKVEGVSRRFGRVVALQEVSLTIRRGELVFVIGPSEAGKTTLLRLIHGDLAPSQGSIWVDGFQLARRWRWFLPRLRRRVGAVFQDHRLLPDMTAQGNVAFVLQATDLWLPPGEAAARARAWLDEVGLAGRASAYPSQLSGGQQRRLAIARALALEPVLLLADEPTANLDRGNADRVLGLLEGRWRAGTTVVVATHDPGLAKALGARTIQLREGRVVADVPAVGRAG